VQKNVNLSQGAPARKAGAVQTNANEFAIKDPKQTICSSFTGAAKGGRTLHTAYNSTMISVCTV
jgi:hypothetical protein